jgi:dTDP-4-dehydrorhamnose reductase
MLRLAQEKTALNVINDQIGAPTGADLIADITAHVVRQVMSLDSNYGLYHLVADGCCSWFDYTQLVLSEAERLGKDLKVKSDQVMPIPSSAYPTAAKRPFNSRLDHQLLSNTFHLHLPTWQLGVKRLVQELCD